MRVVKFLSGVVLVFVGMVFSMRASASRVVFEVHFAPNFISSIYSVGEVGFKRNPQLKYVNMSDSDRVFLQQNRQLFEFGDGQSGTFTFTTFFLPCYLNIGSAEEYARYSSTLKQALLKNDFKDFLVSYPINFSDVFLKNERVFFYLDSAKWEKYIKPNLELYFRVLDIFTKYAQEYEQLFWEEDRRLLEERADHFNACFNEWDVIGKWEKLLSKSFGSDYHISLCRHNSYGPDANSICFDCNVFNGFKKEEMVVDFVSHEVGTHLFYAEAMLNDSLKPVRDRHPQVFYAAFESLAMFYNRMVLCKPLSYSMKNFKGEAFGEVYKKIYHPEISVEEMLRQGVEQIVPGWDRP